MSSQKRAQAFRNFVAEPLDWVAPDSAPDESEELVDTEQTTAEEQN